MWTTWVSSVPVREPPWWYGSPRWPGALLQPVSAIYGFLAQRRLRRAPRERVRLPVVCVGNFTAGGTGKTPLAIHLAKSLSGWGYHPVFLTRGYGGRGGAPRLVDLARDTSAEVGDEALLLARHAPVIVAADRVAGASAIRQAIASASLIIMDDGLQNPHLAKDAIVAVVDGARGFGNGRVIPAGPLRAPLEAQFDLADVIVVNGGGSRAAQLTAELRSCVHVPVLRCQAAPMIDPDALRGRRLLAFCAIGNPERFRVLLEKAGAEVVAWRTFPDHHLFTPREAQALLRDAAALGVELMTTEKDRVRLTGYSGVLGELAKQVHTLPITLQFEGNDDERLIDVIHACLTRHPP